MAVKTLCAWCQSEIGHVAVPTGAPPAVSHGICLSCLGAEFEVPMYELESLTPEQADQLPYGRIVLNASNLVIAYNRTEAGLSHRRPEAVLGKNFFREVAPCTNVAALAGWVSNQQALGETARAELDFIFEFPFGKTFVNIVLLYDDMTEQTTILVAKIAEEPADEVG